MIIIISIFIFHFYSIIPYFLRNVSLTSLSAQDEQAWVFFIFFFFLSVWGLCLWFCVFAMICSLVSRSSFRFCTPFGIYCTFRGSHYLDIFISEEFLPIGSGLICKREKRSSFKFFIDILPPG